MLLTGPLPKHHCFLPPLVYLAGGTDPCCHALAWNRLHCHHVSGIIHSILIINFSTASAVTLFYKTGVSVLRCGASGELVLRVLCV